MKAMSSSPIFDSWEKTKVFLSRHKAHTETAKKLIHFHGVAPTSLFERFQSNQASSPRLKNLLHWFGWMVLVQKLFTSLQSRNRCITDSGHRLHLGQMSSWAIPLRFLSSLESNLPWASFQRRDLILAGPFHFHTFWKIWLGGVSCWLEINE